MANSLETIWNQPSFSTTSHPQTDITNRTLRTSCLAEVVINHENGTSLAQAKFPFNHTVNRSTEKSPFEIVYTCIPRLTFGLANSPSLVDLSAEAEFMADRVELHQEVCHHLEEANASYKAREDAQQHAMDFKIGDLVMVHLKKSHLPSRIHSKLTNKKIGLFPILYKINPNAYSLELPSSMRISNIFNVSDIFPILRQMSSF